MKSIHNKNAKNEYKVSHEPIVQHAEMCMGEKPKH